jgi:hypothetical protein
MTSPRVLSVVATTLLVCVSTSTSLDAEPARAKAASERFRVEHDAAPSFRRHVVPLLGRIGCSGRACHGAFKGQGGFQLSLFGYNFAVDHKALTQGDEPRVDLDDPDASLILLKPTMKKKHRGKKRIEEDSWQYHLLRKWIANGGDDDSEKVGELVRLEVIPSEILFQKLGSKTQLRVLAFWTNGDVEDVTELTRFRTNDEGVTTVSTSGLVTSISPGDSHIVAFYDNGVQPVPVLLPLSDRTGDRHPNVETPTKIDELIAVKHRKMGIVPSDLATDAEFLRRLSVDLSGSMPTPKEVEDFLADTSSDKRARKVEELLASPQYAAWWTTRLCDVTGNNSRQIGEKLFREEISRQWYDWIYRRVADNASYDKIVAGIVLASSRKDGQSYDEFAVQMSSYFRDENPADFSAREDMPHYWTRRNLRKPEEKALGFSYAFLGLRLQCAQCHKHPFDQWSQNDFRHFQAFFDPVRYGNGPKSKVEYKALMTSLEETLGPIEGKDAKKTKQKMLRELMTARVKEGKSIPWNEVYIQELKKPDPKKNKKRKNKKKNPRYDGRVITPKILGGDEVVAERYDDPREPLMEWLREPRNPYFARAFVNRVWANYFGRGIVEPADDMNLANPPSNKALLEHLERGFVESGFDMKWLHRTIVASNAYQRSWRPNETNRLDERNFSRRVLRRLPAEVTWDALVQATASPAQLVSMRDNLQGRAIGPNSGAYQKGNKGARGKAYALGIFGKPARETTCDCERSTSPTLLQTIFTRNDRELWALIDARGGWMHQLTTMELGAQKADRDRERREKARRDKERRNKAKNKKAKNKKAKNKKAKNNDKVAKSKKKPDAAKKAKPAKKATPKLPPTDSLITQVFLRTVSRPPSSEELERARADIAAAKSVSSGVRDLLWVMLNTKEFIVGH